MWRPRREDYPTHRDVVSWYLEGKEATWSEPSYLWPKFSTITQHLLDTIPPPAYLLDVGCFTGYFLRHLSTLGYRGVGVDLQADLMRALHEFCRHGPLDFQFCAMENVAEVFLEETFDAVLCLDVLEHVLDEQRALESVDRVLRPDGRIIFHLPRYDADAEHLRSYTARDDVLRVGSRWRDVRLLDGVDEMGRPTWLVVGKK